MRWLAIFLLLLAETAAAQTTYWHRNSAAGDISACVGTDRVLSLTAGPSGLSVAMTEPADMNWNEAVFAGKTFSGLWDCHVGVQVAGGGGGPANEAEIFIERVDSSCNVQETIIEETTPELTRGANNEYDCTGVTKSVTFAAGEGIMFTITDSRGNKLKRFLYAGHSGQAPYYSWILVPAEVVAAPNKLMIIQ